MDPASGTRSGEDMRRPPRTRASRRKLATEARRRHPKIFVDRVGCAGAQADRYEPPVAASSRHVCEESLDDPYQSIADDAGLGEELGAGTCRCARRGSCPRNFCRMRQHQPGSDGEILERVRIEELGVEQTA